MTFTGEETKSLDRWRFEIKKYGKKQWGVFYQALLAAPISNYGRFNKALNLYGDWPIFDAIVATSNANITGDPLSYVLTVAHAKWKEAQEVMERDNDYQLSIEKSIQQNKESNSELEAKLLRARGGST